MREVHIIKCTILISPIGDKSLFIYVPPSFQCWLCLWEQTIGNKVENSKWKDLDHLLNSRFRSLETDSVIKNLLGNFAAQESILRWVLTGSLPELSSGNSLVVLYWAGTTQAAGEEPPGHSRMSPANEYCEEYFRKKVRRNSAGRYIVSLPIKQLYDSLDCLGSSRPKAYRQFLRKQKLPYFETHLLNSIIMRFY